MAITVTELTSGANGSNLQNYTTASVSPGANKLILVLVSENDSAGGSLPSSVSGAGLTFDLIRSSTGVSGVGHRRTSIYRAMSGSPGTGAITIAHSGVTQNNCLWKVLEVSGIDTTGTNGAGAIVQSNDSGPTSTATPSVTLAAFGDATNNAGLAAFAQATANTFAAGTGWTEIGTEVTNASPNTSFGAQYIIGQDTSVDCTFSGSGSATGVAIEIKAASAGAYTLAAASGAYTESGTAAALRAARKIALVSGSYAYTGTAAGLKRGYPLAAASGAYVITGTAAALREAHKVIAAGGAFVISGTDATLTYDQAGLVLTADPGSFLVAGTAAGLREAHRLAAASGAYSISGTASTLAFARYIRGIPGAYVISGTNATLDYSGAAAVTHISGLALMGVG